MPFGPTRATRSLGCCIALARCSNALVRSTLRQVLKGVPLVILQESRYVRPLVMSPKAQ
jgi:hypothetical protein